MVSLQKIALITSILGIILLIFLSLNLEPRLIPISEISEEKLEKYVKISGYITEIKKTEAMTILTIEDSYGEIKAIAYELLDIEENIKIELIGKIISYKNELEIEISELKEI